jgi:hypothetical protein
VKLEVYIVHKLGISLTSVYTTQLKLENLYKLKYFVTPLTPQLWMQPYPYSPISIFRFRFPIVMRKCHFSI